MTLSELEYSEIQDADSNSKDLYPNVCLNLIVWKFDSVSEKDSEEGRQERACTDRGEMFHACTRSLKGLEKSYILVFFFPILWTKWK